MIYQIYMIYKNENGAREWKDFLMQWKASTAVVATRV